MSLNLLGIVFGDDRRERRKNDRTRDGLNKHQETIRDKDGETERERDKGSKRTGLSFEMLNVFS